MRAIIIEGMVSHVLFHLGPSLCLMKSRKKVGKKLHKSSRFVYKMKRPIHKSVTITSMRMF